MTEPARERRLVVVTGNYPSEGSPTSGTFVRAFVHALVDAGTEADVIHGVSVFARRHGPYPVNGEERTPGGRRVRIHRPRFLSLSIVGAGPLGTARLTQSRFESSILREVRQAGLRPTMAYGHFLYQSGRAAVRVGESLGVPSFVAVGEGTFWTVEPIGFDRARRDFATATGFIAVSSPIRKGLESRLGIPREKIGVFPNGVDREVFRPKDQQLCRRRLGLPQARPILVFVGAFDDLKGGQTVLEAARGLPEVGIVLLGRGPVPLESGQIVFKGAVPHELVPDYLNAADAFVLPTLEEGSCNAIIEAMACGLPIITSRADYVEDLLDENSALLIDPRDPIAVRGAMQAVLSRADLRAELSRHSRLRAEALDVRDRARRVLAWMDERAAIGMGPRAIREGVG